MRNLTRIAALAALAILVLPTAVFAKDNNKNGDDNKRDKNRGEVRASVSRNNNDDESRKNKFNEPKFLGMFFQAGTVTAVSSTGFTMKTRNSDTLVVNTANAKLIRVPNTVIALGDIHVNDKVWVQGTMSGTQLNAAVVYNMQENVSPAMKKGTVTAVNGSQITVQTKHNSTVTVNTDANTQVKQQDGDVGTVADVQVGSKVKVFGLWDKILNVLSALKIKIK